MGAPGFPVAGSMGTRSLLRSSVAYRVFRGAHEDAWERLPARAGRSHESHEDEPEGSRREQRPPHGLRLQDREENCPSGAAGKRLAVSNSSQSPAEMPQLMPDRVMRP